jgi:hypothetical protein
LCAVCGGAVIFNMFDVSHRGELTEADFSSVYGEVCKAGIDPPQAHAADSGTSDRAGAASAGEASADGTEEMLATLATVAGKGIHGFVSQRQDECREVVHVLGSQGVFVLQSVGVVKAQYDTTGSSRLSFTEFGGLMKQDGRIQVLRMDVSTLLAPGLLG